MLFFPPQFSKSECDYISDKEHKPCDLYKCMQRWQTFRTFSVGKYLTYIGSTVDFNEAYMFSIVKKNNKIKEYL